jgi:hypothetical protein
MTSASRASFFLAALAIPTLSFVACGGGDGTSSASFAPASTAAGGASAGSGTAGKGTGGTASSGAGGASAAGSGGSSTAGSGGSSTAGSGGSSSAGTGGSATAGSGGSATAGSGGSSTAGQGGTASAGAGGTASGGAGGGTAQAIQNVFVIMMENHSATSVYGSGSAAYVNGTLLKQGAHATAYKTSIHPSEPNYIWLEAGSNLTIVNDNDPGMGNQLTTTDHLVSQLVGAGVSWKAYVEDIDGKSCPLTSSNLLGNYGVKHVPQLFFSDVTEGFKTTSANCISHVRPFGELASDLKGGNAPRYSFIVPNLCNDMHGATGCALQNLDEVKAGDDWLKANVPTILGSSAFANGGLLLIVWDEGDEPLLGTASDGPLPFIALGNMVKPGYAGSVAYSHSSTLKTIEEIFGVPLLRGAGDAGTNDLADLFTAFPLVSCFLVAPFVRIYTTGVDTGCTGCACASLAHRHPSSGSRGC